MKKILIQIILYAALAAFWIYPANAQLTVAKRLVSSVSASDFSPNVLPPVTAWTMAVGAALDNGNTAIKLTNTNGQQAYAYYFCNLNQTTPRMIRIAGESYSQGVTFTSPSLAYSLRVDITYNDKSTELYTCVPFSGKSTWEAKDFTFIPQKPIQSVLVMVMLYIYTGNAWFQNITLQENIGVAASPGKFGDTAVFNQTTAEGYLIRQFADTENWYDISDGQTGQNWSFAATSKTAGKFTTHTATITNTGASQRAGILAYRIPVTGANLKWCNTADMRTQTLMNSLALEYSDESLTFTNAKSYSKLLWGCIVSDTTGYAIAVDPDYPCQFKIRYSACNQEFFILFDLGFTASGSARDNATVKFVTWTFNPAAGARQAVHDFYKLYPNAYRDQIVESGGEHGIWWYQRPLVPIYINNMNDFGFKFDQQPPNSVIPFDDDNDFLSTLYVAPWEMRLYGANLQGWPNPSAAVVAQRLNDLYIAGDPTATAIVNSACKDSTGKYRYITTTPGWSSDYIRFQSNPAPGVRPNISDASNLSERNTYYDQWLNPVLQTQMTAPKTWDGILCDNVTNCYLALCADKTAIDYDSSHFNRMATPLVHDINAAVGIGSETMIWEYFNGMRQGMEKLMDSDNRLRVIQANGVPSPFAGCKLDIHGGEQVWDVNNTWSPPVETAILEYRMKAGRKPLVFMQNPFEHSVGTGSSWMTNARTQKFFARGCAFGIMPSFGITDGGNSAGGLMYFETPAFFETANPNTRPPNMSDRNLFQKYIPVIRKLSQAGWDPVRLATVNDSEVFIERFGVEYITVFNPSASSKTVTVTYLPAPVSITGKELISGNNVTWANGLATLTVAAEDIAVLEIPSLINFKFDEGSGSPVAASPYTNITGTAVNTSQADGVDGQSGHALSFNGSASYVDLPGNKLFAVSDDGVTFSAWVKPGAIVPSYNMVISHGSSHYLALYNGYVFFYIATDSGVSHWSYGYAQLTANTWYHIAGSYDREGKMKVFINGRQNGSTTGPFFNPDSNTNTLSIGKYCGAGLYYFNGIIEDVQICRRGSSDKDIRKLKDNAIIAYSLPLNEGAGTVAYDDFDRTRQAAITGATWHGNTTLDKKDNALYFNGVNNYVTIPGSTTFRTDGGNGFTLAAWIKADGAFSAGHRPVIARGSTYLTVYSGKLGFKTITDAPANTQRYCGGSTNVSPNVWHHVAAVYEANGNMKVYLDGVQDGSTVGPYPNLANEAYNIQLGTWGNYFKGIISNARIYKRGLTGDEIKLLYQNNE